MFYVRYLFPFKELFVMLCFIVNILMAYPIDGDNCHLYTIPTIEVLITYCLTEKKYKGEAIQMVRRNIGEKEKWAAITYIDLA